MGAPRGKSGCMACCPSLPRRCRHLPVGSASTHFHVSASNGQSWRLLQPACGGACERQPTPSPGRVPIHSDRSNPFLDLSSQHPHTHKLSICQSLNMPLRSPSRLVASRIAVGPFGCRESRGRLPNSVEVQVSIWSKDAGRRSTPIFGVSPPGVGITRST